MNANRKFPVMEVFGPTVQGEGMVVGRKTMFVRTGGCDYRCSWCDSAFTWDGTGKDEMQQLTATEIIEKLDALGGEAYDHVTLSGGNPALLHDLHLLIDLLHERGKQVALETQGSRWQDWFLRIDDLTISPKPPSSGMRTDWEKLDYIIHQLEQHHAHACIKVVIFDEEDLAYAKTVHLRYPNFPFYVQAGNGELTEQDNSKLLPYLIERYEWLIQLVMEDVELKSVYVLPQLHTWVWGNKKGV